MSDTKVALITGGSAYDAAVQERYRWHEFGDSASLLP